jgi:hypothetical protein
VPSLFDRDEFNERLFFPRREQSAPPPGSEDLRIAVEPGISLHVRAHSALGARCVVLLFHGNGEVVSDYDAIAPSFARLGCALIVADFRGYGASDGKPTLRSLSRDASIVAGVIRERVRSLPMIVFGRSLGAHCASQVAGALPPVADALVLESAATSLQTMAERRSMRLDAPLSDEDRAVFDPLPKLARCALPTLVLHGTIDAIIRPDEAQRAFDAIASEHKSLRWIEHRGHNDSSLSPEYWSALRAFVDGLVASR